MGKLRVGPPPQDGDVDFAIHHMLAVRHGGKLVEDFYFATAPDINVEAASQPVTLGFSTLRHVSLETEFELMPVAPPLVGGPPKRASRKAALREIERDVPRSSPPGRVVIDEPVEVEREAA